MLTFNYTARDKSTGQKVSSEVQASDERAAAKLLSDKGLIPLDIKEKASANSGVKSVINRISTKEKVIFSRQLSTLINAGLPIVQSLNNVKDQTNNKPLKVVIAHVVSDVEAGSSLAGALTKHPKVFDRVYVSLVAAGEASGTLDKALERLADQQEKDADIISKVRGAMIYPLIVILVMIGVVIFMLTTVLPQVQNLYSGLPGVKLPLITRVLLDISHGLTRYWWIILLVLGILTFMTTRWARTGPGKQVVDSLKMKVWPVGPLFTKLYMARFSRTGATLVGSGVPLLQMLSITAEAVNNVHVADSINKAAEKVKGGAALSEGLSGDPNFPDLVPNMIRIGEESGALERMLGKSADYYEKQVDDQIRNISTLVEPVLMVMIGGVAFMVVAAVLLPIYGLVGHIGVNGIH
jgi:type IV pilus assembly protein PilC